MSPILGIWASADQSQFISTNSYESIQTYTIGAGGQASVTFSSIPSTYKHLQIRSLTATAQNSVEWLSLRFNSDTATNYDAHRLFGNGATAGSAAYTSIDQIYTGFCQGPNNVANTFGASVIDILDYANTNKYKTLRALSGVDTNNVNGGYINLASGAWRSTSAVTSITLFEAAGYNLRQYSSFALYGIRG